VTCISQRVLSLESIADGDWVIVGEPRGGLPLSVAISHRTDVRLASEPSRGEKVIWIDDIVDSGKTFRSAVKRFGGRTKAFFAWVNKDPEMHQVPAVLTVPRGTWVVFPWEAPAKAIADREDYRRRRDVA
jgi:adenine/guanine phosphoribosyltransferase-like PRPP-binding protein